MTQRFDNPANPLEKALAEATRTMAEAPELANTHTGDPTGLPAP